MKKINYVARTLAFVSIAALIAGCKTPSTQEQVTGTIPNDYRLRHPIAVREKAQSLTVLVGDARGALTPSQRAEVGDLADLGALVVEHIFGHEHGQRQREQSDGENGGHHHDGDDLPAHLSPSVSRCLVWYAAQVSVNQARQPSPTTMQ